MPEWTYNGGTVFTGAADPDDLAVHAADTTSVHGVADTSVLATQTDITAAKARANHTGSQAIATVTGLQTALDAKQDASSAATDAEVTAAVAAEASLRSAADTALDVRVDALEVAPPAHTHDDRYYTESESDTLLAAKQAADADLTAIAGLSPSNDDVIQRKSGAWTNRTPAQVKTDLALAKGDVGLGNVDNTSDITKLLVSVSAQTNDYTLVLADAGKAVEVTSASAEVVTVPPNSSVAFPVGTVIEVCQMGAGAVSIAPGSGVTIRSYDGLLDLAGQYAAVSLRKRATDEWVLAGALA